MKKRTTAAAFLITVFCPWSALNAQQITKVAVLDYARILTAFYADSSAVEEIEALKTQFAEDVKRLQNEIQSLEQRRLDAMDRGDSRGALDLESRIQERKQYYQEFVRVRGNQIQRASAELASSDKLAQDILREIQYVAESNGFSIVLKRSDAGLLWWSYETDITELVLRRLMRGE